MERLAEMTWTKLESAITPETVAILPIGAIEQHGYGPLGTDFFLSTKLAEKVAKQVPGSVLIPGLPFGMSRHHTAFPGTISFDNVSEFQAVVERIFWNLYRSGFRRIYVVNGHGGNKLGINNAARAIQVFCQDFKIQADNVNYMDNTKPQLSRVNDMMNELCKACGEAEMSHGDAAEFSLLFALMPEAKNMLDNDLSARPPLPDLTQISSVRDPEEWREKMAPCRGGKGDPRRAQPEIALLVVEAYVAQMAKDAAEGWSDVKIEKPGWHFGTHEGNK